METAESIENSVHQSSSETQSPETEKKPEKTKLLWWQWVLMYPALALALLGHIMPIVEKVTQSHEKNVPINRVDEFIRQKKLWEKNLDCIREMTFHNSTTSSKDNVSVGICESGDVLVNVVFANPGAEPHSRWVSFSDLKQDTANSSLLVSKAWAEPIKSASLVAQGGSTVICRRWVGDGRLLMRLSYPDGHCVDQIINTFTGAVMSTSPAPCSPRC